MLENVPARQSSKGAYSTVYHTDLVVMVAVMVEMEKSEESIMHSKSTELWTVPNKHRRLCSQKRLWRWLVCCCAAAPFRSLLSRTGSVTLSMSHGLHTHLNLDKKGYGKREETSALHQQQQQQYSSQPTQQETKIRPSFFFCYCSILFLFPSFLFLLQYNLLLPIPSSSSLTTPSPSQLIFHDVLLVSMRFLVLAFCLLLVNRISMGNEHIDSFCAGVFWMASSLRLSSSPRLSLSL